MLEMASVHIWKTGGTTLVDALRRKYGLRLRLYYPPPLAPARARIRAQLRQAYGLALAPFSRAVHGHFPASQYADTNAEMIVFVRDPVEIRASAYHYVRRRFESVGMIANDAARNALDMDLHEFLARPTSTLGHFLDVPIDRFAFVGSMAHFDEDLARLSDRLGVPHISRHVNASPTRYEIPDECRRSFARLNPGEVDLYHAALERRRQLAG